jgi:signal transduction histidine kinase
MMAPAATGRRESVPDIDAELPSDHTSLAVALGESASLAGVLALAGLRMHQVESAQDVLEAVKGHNPELILLSNNSAGSQLCEVLRKECAYSGVICVCIEAPATPAQIADWTAGGAVTFLERSAGEAAHIAIIGGALRERRLEQKLAAAAGSVDQLRAKLRSAQQDFQQFALHASHDFQEAVRSVNAFSQLIAQERGTALSERERQYIQYMLGGTERMRELLDYILIYSQAAADNFAAYSLIDLNGVAHAALKSLQKRVAESGAVVTVGPSLPVVWAHMLRLQQVLHSLITNAIKYRRPDTPVHIRIDAARHLAGQWKISVGDNGIGIAAQYHESIFSPFKRLHGKNIPGCGMGLAVCRRIIDAHGGRIWMESVPGGGSDFHFTLREAAPAA